MLACAFGFLVELKSVGLALSWLNLINTKLGTTFPSIANLLHPIKVREYSLETFEAIKLL